MRLLEGDNVGFGAIIKAENCTESDGNPVENMVKTEAVEFRNNSYICPHAMMDTVTVTLEKIPKTETTTILDDEPPNDDGDCDEEDYDPSRDVKYSDVDSESDPERDPFGDIDCDPCFSPKPPPQSDIPNGSVIQLESVNTTAVDVDASSNPPSFPKALNNNRERKRFEESFQCQLCLETQHSRSKLKSHLEICEASHKNRRRFCELCNFLFSVPQSYRKHALKTHGIKDAKKCFYPFKCQFCPRTFGSEKYLISHAAASHQESSLANNKGVIKPKPFKCQECPATFSSSNGLSNHMKSKKNERPFKCSLPNCEKAYNLRSHLKVHLRIAHSEEKPSKCRVLNCDKSFKFSYQLHRHMFSHSVDTPFKCPHADCDRAFKSKEGVTKHLLVHAGARRYSHITERPFQCDQCRRAFCKNWQLTVHLKLVHPENRKGGELFECPEPNCETTFKYKHNIKAHLAVFHTGNQLSFTCPEPNCSKSFKTKQSVKDHLRIHTRPYKCTQPGCSAAFPNPKYLNSHIKSKHK